MSSKLLAKKKLEENNLHQRVGNDTLGVPVKEQEEYENVDLAAENIQILRKRERKVLLV